MARFGSKVCNIDIVVMQLPARQLLRAVRGKRSQVAFSRRLGYRGNPVAAWEAGRRSPTAAEFVRACVVAGIDVEHAFKRFHAAAPPAANTVPGLADWLDRLRGNTSVSSLARRASLPRVSVSRWLGGRTSPKLADFLALVEAITGRVSDLVAEMVSIELVPSLLHSHRRRVAARTLAHEEPWTEAILRLLETHTGSFVEGRIAACLGIDPELERRCMEKLLVAGIIEPVGDSYVVGGELNVDTRAATQLRSQWTSVALARIANATVEDVLSYNVFSVSEAELREITDLLRATFRQIRTIASHSTRPERAALVNLQLVCWPALVGSEGTPTPAIGAEQE